MMPALWSLITSFRYESRHPAQPHQPGADPLTLEHYERILGDGQVSPVVCNSLAVVGAPNRHPTRALLARGVCVRADPVPGKRPLYILVLIGLMVPFEAILIPVYLLIPMPTCTTRGRR